MEILKMKTGDILLFKGNGIFSALIMALPGADYSHVGLFVDHPEHGPCVFESTSLGKLNDIKTGYPICGVQLTKYEDRIKSYDGDVFVRPIVGDRTDAQLKKLYAFIGEHHGTPYEKDNLQLARAELDLFPWQKNEPDPSSLFCSEAVIMALRDALFIVDSGVSPNEHTPTDCSDDTITLFDGLCFGEIEEIAPPN
jgi:hypothetical protein